MTSLARASRESAGWLGEALDRLDEIATGFEVDGPVPDQTVVLTSRDFLRDLAHRVATEPGIDDDGLGGVSVEFVGREGDRVLFVIERDLSSSYHENIRDRAASNGYDDWRQMMSGVGDAWIVRSELQRAQGGRPVTNPHGTVPDAPPALPDSGIPVGSGCSDSGCRDDSDSGCSIASNTNEYNDLHR